MKTINKLLGIFLGCILLLNSCTTPGDPEGPDKPLLEDTWETLLNSPFAINRKHDDLFFVNQLTGWLVTRTGGIYKTTDGGEHWASQYAGSQFFRAVGFADSLRGWAANLQGDEGDLLFQTTDGGTSWIQVTNIPEPKPPGICGIWVVDQQTIYAAGRLQGPAIIIKSTDGGATWTSIDMQQRAGMLIDIHFWSRTEGMVIGGTSSSLTNSRMLILSTTDGGETWTERFTGTRTAEWGWKISFPTRMVGYVSIQTSPSIPTGNEFFLKTTDGGLTWSEKRFSDTHYSAQGIGFLTPDIGWMGSYFADKQILATTDGGETWHSEGYGIINRFRFIDGTVGYASGAVVYKRSF